MSNKHPVPWSYPPIKGVPPRDANGDPIEGRDAVDAHNALAAENARLREVLGKLVEIGDRLIAEKWITLSDEPCQCAECGTFRELYAILDSAREAVKEVTR